MNDKFKDVLLAIMIAFNIIITFTLLVCVITDKQECKCPCCTCTEEVISNG